MSPLHSFKYMYPLPYVYVTVSIWSYIEETIEPYILKQQHSKHLFDVASQFLRNNIVTQKTK